jgi:hypothetical protein
MRDAENNEILRVKSATKGMFPGKHALSFFKRILQKSTRDQPLSFACGMPYLGLPFD